MPQIQCLRHFSLEVAASLILSLRDRSPNGAGSCLQYPFLRAGERFDIGANPSSQVTREVGLADLKASTGAPRQCYWIQHPTPLAVRSGSDNKQMLPRRKAPVFEVDSMATYFSSDSRQTPTYRKTVLESLQIAINELL